MAPGHSTSSQQYQPDAAQDREGSELRGRRTAAGRGQ